MQRLWLMLTAVMAVSFGVLGWVGTRIYQEMPPIPDRVVTTEGKTVFDSGAIQEGQNVWQTMGGMEVGSVWGHGSYVAPDWTADWLGIFASRQLFPRSPKSAPSATGSTRETYSVFSATIFP